MADNNENNQWPLPAFYFSVDIADIGEIACKEVTGLDTETQMIEYRSGNSPDFSTRKMPGIKKVPNVTLKKGVFKGDNKFFEWYNSIKLNTVERKVVTIKLLDETGGPTMVWELSNAWPTKVTGVSLKSDGNEAAVEGIELAHEGLKISNEVK